MKRITETDLFLQRILQYRPEELPTNSPAGVASFLYEFLHQEEAHTKEMVPPVYGMGSLWVYFPLRGVWVPVFDEELCSLVARWDGVLLQNEDKRFRVGKGDDKAIVRMLANRCLANLKYGMDRDQVEWMSEGDSGLAFSDIFVRVEEEKHRLTLKTTPPHHTDRTIHAFDIPCPSIPDINSQVSDREWTMAMLGYLKSVGASNLHLYLSSVWSGDIDEYANIRFLAQFAGVALLGKATDQRFMRALILQGPPGTGKSTFIKMLRGLFPDKATSSVPPHNFHEHDKISSMRASRYNYIEELSKEPIRSDSSLRSIIDGARVQVRDPYVKNYFFSPQCAHLFGCNRLPNIPGADNATWRRFAVLKLNNVVRDTTQQVVDIDKVVEDQERPHLISWALAGAMDAFAHNKYLVPASALSHLQEWSKDADSVSVFVAEECSDDDNRPMTIPDTKGAVRLSELYSCYHHWCREFGYSPVSKGEFKARVKSQGIDIRKNSVDHALLLLNEHGKTRLEKVLALGN